MSRRTRTTSIPCNHAACRETGRFEYDSQKELARICRDHANWKCVRHGAGDAVLAADNASRSAVLEVVILPHLPNHRFWKEPGAVSASGFVYGPGFQAHAEDFPVGTKLTVTASVVLPDPQRSPGGTGEGGR